MAKISKLEQLLSLTGEEVLPIAINGQNFRVKLKDFKVLINKADIGLGNVNNTNDLDKPISVAMQSALNQRAMLSHSHNTIDIIGIDALIHNHILSMQLVDTVDIGIAEW